MRAIALLLGLGVAAGAGWGTASQAAEMYRWVDEAGQVHYSDQPPPPAVRHAERRRLGDRGGEATLPYTLREAVRQFPVTVYTAEGCGQSCKQALSYLSRRGVPFTEKDARIAENAELVMSHTGGKLEVPLLIVGRSALRGYEETTWAATLDAAGYPRSNALPPGVAARQVEPNQMAKDTTEPAAGQPADASPETPASN
jgi:glutaredoxin